MKPRVFSLAFLGLLIGGITCAQAASPSPAPAPSPSLSASPGSVDAAILLRAKEWLHRLQTGDIDRSQLDAKVNAALTADVVKQTSAQFSPLGDPVTFTFLGKQPVGTGMTAYVYRVVFKSATLNEVFVLDKDGKISGIQFPPAQ